MLFDVQSAADELRVTPWTKAQHGTKLEQIFQSQLDMLTSVLLD